MDEADRNPREPPEAPRPDWFRQVTFHSLLAGLCPLIPIPFLDDRVLAGVRRKMVRELASEQGWTGEQALDREAVDWLAGTRGESRGCLGWIGWIAFSLTLRLAAKIFRKILIIFAVKESVDTASRVFHEGYLLHLTFAWAPSWSAQPGREEDDDGRAAGLSPRLSPGRARAVRGTIEATLDDVDPRPLEQILRRTFRGSRRLLRRGARLLTRRGAAATAQPAQSAQSARDGRQGGGERALPEDEERRLLGRVLDGLVADLWEERGYLAALEERYRDELSAPTTDDREAGAGREAGPMAGSGAASSSASEPTQDHDPPAGI